MYNLEVNIIWTLTQCESKTYYLKANPIRYTKHFKFNGVNLYFCVRNIIISLSVFGFEQPNQQKKHEIEGDIRDKVKNCLKSSTKKGLH